MNSEKGQIGYPIVGKARTDKEIEKLICPPSSGSWSWSADGNHLVLVARCQMEVVQGITPSATPRPIPLESWDCQLSLCGLSILCHTVEFLSYDARKVDVLKHKKGFRPIISRTAHKQRGRTFGWRVGNWHKDFNVGIIHFKYRSRLEQTNIWTLRHTHRNHTFQTV